MGPSLTVRRVRLQAAMAGLMRRHGERLRALAGEFTEAGPPDPRRLVLWAPVALGAGSAAYFALPAEPPHGAPAVLCALAAALVVCSLFLRAFPRIFYSCVLVALMLAGAGMAQHRANSLAPPAIEISDRARTVDAWIERVERSGARERLVLRVISLEGASQAPKRVRVRADLGEFEPGDLVRVRAVLDRPAGPAAPGGYDPARAAWFDGLAFTGFAIARPERLVLEEAPDRFERGFTKWRWHLAGHIREVAGPHTGGIAAALLTGDRSGVGAEDAEALRLSGLGHILAISGLHMALLAGAVYFAARFAFAAIEPYARAHDPRKPAALVALLAAAGYLVLSGASVSTQRAFVMTAVVLVGVLLDRRAFSIRSLALAALAVLLLAPESVIEVGFQMSFAAVAALIASFDLWQRWRGPVITERTWFTRARGAFYGLAATSLIAGSATGAFAAFHFQRLAAYGFFANLLAMPVFTFWVMPAGVAALAVMPFGFDAPLLRAMDWGLRIVLEIAHRTADADGSEMRVNAAPGLAIALFGLGFALATIGRGLARLYGLGLCMAGFAAWSLASPPSMLVTDSGSVVARFAPAVAEPAAQGGWSVSDRRRGRFDTRVFLQRVGESDSAPGRAQLACDTLGCTGRTLDGLLIAFTASGQALEEDCERADIIVFDGVVSPYQQRNCAALVLDAPERERLGSAEFWVRDGEVMRLRGANTERGERPWTVPPEG